MTYAICMEGKMSATYFHSTAIHRGWKVRGAEVYNNVDFRDQKDKFLKKTK